MKLYFRLKMFLHRVSFPVDGRIFLLGLIFLLPISHLTSAQSRAGLTQVPDTSYTNYSAYQSTRKNHPEISMVQNFKIAGVSETAAIVYCEQGKRKLRLDVFYPSKSSSVLRTAVIMIHGGGWRSGNRTQHHPLAQKLAEKGYVCFTPEYRLSTEALFPAAVYDLKAAIRWIRKHAAEYQIDTSAIAIAGFSAGGELAAFMGTTGDMPLFEGQGCTENTSSHVNAIINMDGTLSFIHSESGEGDDSKKTSAATYWFGYGKAENPELWRIASPLTWVGAHTPPVLFINSAVERMHAGRTDFIKVLDSNHIYSEVHTFEGAPHSFPQFSPWFDPTINFIDQFLKKIFKKE